MKRSIVFTLLLVSTQMACADWKLNNDLSVLSFMSTKNAAITEVHSFKHITGMLSESGKAQLKIDLDSVETNVPIRNERVRQFLFETDKYASAEVELQVNMNALRKLKVGEIKSLKIDATLSLHGIKKEIQTTVNVYKGLNSTINVATVSPIILQTPAYQFEKGLAKLQEIANLQSIATSVPVVFSLQFDKE